MSQYNIDGVTIKINGEVRKDFSRAEVDVINRIAQSYNDFEDLTKGSSVIQDNAYINGVRNTFEFIKD